MYTPRLTTNVSARRGAIAPLSAILAVFVMGMVAFAIDTSWMVLSQSELQNAADASALAGVNKLMDPCVLYNLPGQKDDQKAAILSAALASARQAAKDYAAANGAGGLTSLALRDADIEFGFINAANSYTAYSSSSTFFPNTVKVLLRRDDVSNGRLALSFGPAIGTSSVAQTASASATMYAGVISSLKENPNLNIHVLPMTYDVNDWDSFVQTGKDARGRTSFDESGNPKVEVYSRFSDKGNFGELALDDEHAGSSEIRGWISAGMLASDTAMLTGRGLLPVTAHDKTKWDWLGNPGFRSTTVQEVNDFEGKSFLLPLFIPKVAGSSNANYQAGIEEGSHYAYNITRFVGIKIVVSNQGNRDIHVQPAAVIEPNAVFDPTSIAPAGSTADANNGSYLVTTFTTPRLSR